MEKITKCKLFEECKSYLDNGEMPPNFEKEYVSVEDVDNLFEKYEINLQEEVDELKKALKDEIPEFTSTVFDYGWREAIDSVFAQHGLEKEKVKDDINLSNVSSKPHNNRCTCNTCMGYND